MSPKELNEASELVGRDFYSLSTEEKRAILPHVKAGTLAVLMVQGKPVVCAGRQFSRAVRECLFSSPSRPVSER